VPAVRPQNAAAERGISTSEIGCMIDVADEVFVRSYHEAVVSVNHYDVIVIGAGGVGSAALYHTAKRGVRVLGLDRFPPGHDRGSSHGQTRVIRIAYYEHPDYVPLMLRAYELWDELEQAVDMKLLYQVGALFGGPPDGEIVSGVLRAAAEHN